MSLENATLNEILSRARVLVGKTVKELVPNAVHNEKDKGSIGNLLQLHGFGIPVNNNPNPDFKKEGIELKVVPLTMLKRNNELTIKERTKICSIDYSSIIKETWLTSHAKNKLNRVLFVFYSYEITEPLTSKVQSFLLYELAKHEEDEVIFQDDWAVVKNLTEQGRSHELTEKLFTFLSASTSGAGGQASNVKQPITTITTEARKRSFSLKPAYTRVLWNLARGIQYDNLSSVGPVFHSRQDIETKLLHTIGDLNGKSLEEISAQLGIEISSGKDYAAKLVRSALGFKGKYKPIKELEQLGLIVKAIPIRTHDKMPWEGLSFPHQTLKEIIDEASFEESELRQHIEGILIIPIDRETRIADNKNKFIGKAFIWRPGEQELSTVKEEWENYRSIIRTSLVVKETPANTKVGIKRTHNLPPESATKIIHIRPHATDGTHVDTSIPGITLTKQSLWLNKRFIQSLIIKNT